MVCSDLTFGAVLLPLHMYFLEDYNRRCMDITTYAFYYFLLHRSNVSLTGFINFCDLDIPRDILPHLLATEIPNTFNASISYSYLYFLVISCACFHDLSHIPNYFTSNKVAVSVVSIVVHVNSTVLVMLTKLQYL